MAVKFWLFGLIVTEKEKTLGLKSLKFVKTVCS